MAEKHGREGAGLGPGLYLVATPIGSAGDITLRALEVLGMAGIIAAEDTRRTRQLLAMHGIALGGRRLMSYNDRNGPERRPVILGRLAEGASVALVSDAGTPLLADPGYRLVQEAIAAGHKVVAVPGASALLAALSVAGLPTDRFLFAGFPPARQAARERFLREMMGYPFTIVMYESPRRVRNTLQSMAEIFGEERPAALCRELTKRFEETRRGTLGALAAAVAAEREQRGEIVILVGPAGPPAPPGEAIEAALRQALRNMSLKDAVRTVAEATGAPRREVYARALRLARA
ncbi:MAG TPA: 16S rRNA (cytidine(1402)-2'-O)-methyltransferase [Paracoccaceae bacterium]|nr:16S rRNA (cytidine(1402)-2'-O)-methyltransferase [Paracoccaceae bacterium]